MPRAANFHHVGRGHERQSHGNVVGVLAGFVFLPVEIVAVCNGDYLGRWVSRGDDSQVAAARTRLRCRGTGKGCAWTKGRSRDPRRHDGVWPTSSSWAELCFGNWRWGCCSHWLVQRVGAALSTGSFSGRLPLTLMVAAAIMPMFTFVSVRADMAMHLDRLGQSSQAPGEEDVDGLTSLGTLLFVSLPMVALATMLGL